MRVPAVSIAVLALASGAAVHAAPAAPSCESYTRTSPAAPEVVRRWLALSSDDHVRACAAPGANGAGELLYSGGSAVTRDGQVCGYSSHGLALAGSSSKRELRRYERGEARYLAVSAAACPPAYSQDYIETYDVSSAAFVAILQLWRRDASSARSFDHDFERVPGSAPDAALANDTAARLRAAIESGRMSRARVARIVRVAGSAFRHRYALFVADPERAAQDSTLYVIYLRHTLGSAWHISGVADAAD